MPLGITPCAVTPFGISPSVVAVLLIWGVGVGTGSAPLGISPAFAEQIKTHTSTEITRDFFITFPFDIWEGSMVVRHISTAAKLL